MNHRWMLTFLRLVLRDTINVLVNVLRYMSGIKTIKLLLVTFFTVQLLYFVNKFFVYADFSISWLDFLSLVYIIGVFPFVFTYEKFLSGSFFGECYDFTDGKILTKARDKFAFYGKSKRAWLVYLLSQAAVMIDVVIFTAIFTLVLFVTKFDYATLSSWVFLGAYVVVAMLLFIVAVFLWNRTFQIFRFWDTHDNLCQAVSDSHTFTTSQPRRFIKLHTLVKFTQFLLPTLAFLIIYKYAGTILTLTQKAFTQTASVYVIMTALALIAFFAYQFLVAFANVYAFRLIHYFEHGYLDSRYVTTYMRPVGELKKLLLINRLTVLALIVAFSFFVYSQVVASRAITEKVESRYPNVIKLYSGGLSSTTTVDTYMTPRYANGIAVAVFTKDGELYAQPLVAQMNNALVPTSISAADIAFFNLSQPFTPAQLHIPFNDAIEYSNARKFALFVYVNDEETANVLALPTTTQPHLTIFFTDNPKLSERLKSKLAGYRVGTLVKVVDIESYGLQSVFLFNKDVHNKRLQTLRDKNVKVYVILQAGESPDPALDLSLVQGVLTDLPQVSYSQVRNISEEDVLKKVILSPLKLFGF